MHITSLLLALAIYITYRLLSSYLTPHISNIPSPFLARLTNVPRFLDACRDYHHLTILSLHKKYDAIARLGPKVGSISDASAVDEILGFKANLDKSDQVKPMQNAYNGESLPMLVSAKDAETHARIRGPVAGAYSMTNVHSFEGLVDECIVKTIEGLMSKCGSDGKCEIDRWMHFFAFDFIGMATFGHSFGSLDSGEDVDNMLQMMDWKFIYIATLGTLPWLDYLLLKNPILLAVIETPNPLVDLASKYIRERRSDEGGSREKKRDFLSHFLEAQQVHPDSVSDLYTATSILATSDTTGSALTSIIWLVLTHPAVKAKLQNELDAAAPNLSDPLSFTRAQQLPYLDAMIKETLRFYPTVGIELERMVRPAGLTLSSSGHYFPPGIIVGVNPWTIHRDESIFGADAYDFVPERWLRGDDETEDEFEQRRNRMRRTLLTFGSGPRVCLGRNVALMEIYKMVATLFGTLDVGIVDAEKSVKVRTDISVKICGLEVRVKARERRPG